MPDGLNLHWFSPLPPQRTGIARYSVDVLAALRARPGVSVAAEDPAHPDWPRINDAHAVIYHIGNHGGFHGRIWELSALHPGIIVLHDTTLQSLFLDYYAARHQPDAWLDLNEKFYGLPGRLRAERFRHGAAAAELQPLFQPAVQNALGVIVHTPQALQLLGDAPFPVALLPLAFAASPMPPPRPSAPPRTCRLIAFGHFGANRDLAPVIEAIAGLHAGGIVRLDVYGTLSMESEIRQLIAARGVEDRVTLHGYCSDQQLEHALSTADLAVNLRFPSMGEASLSQLQIWNHALPSLVTSTGWYETLPADTVVKIPPGEYQTQIRAQLLRFLSHPGEFAEIGHNGRRHLLAAHSAERYADGLLQFVGLARQFQPRQATYGLADRTGIAIERAFQNSTGPAFAASIARRIAALATPRR